MDLTVLILVVINVAIAGWLIFLTSRYRAILAKMGTLFSGDEKSLGERIKNYIEDVKAVENHCYLLDKEVKKVNKLTERSLHRKGFVRYNPFGDVGGNQSFSLCLLDAAGDGYVISSIHSREGTRVYAKTVEGGRSEYNLSEEEKKSIELALKN